MSGEPRTEELYQGSIPQDDGAARDVPGPPAPRGGLKKARTARITNYGVVIGGATTAPENAYSDYYVHDTNAQQGDEESESLLNSERRSYEISGHHIVANNEQVSSTRTLINLIKGNIGTGILAMPDAIKHSGLLTGCLLLPCVAFMCIYSMHMLVRVCTELKARSLVKQSDYAYVAGAAFAAGPRALTKLSKPAYFIVNFFLVVTQMGFCCVYVVFISANLKMLIGTTSHDLHLYIICVTLSFLCFSFIHGIKILTYFSLISNICIVVGLSLIMRFLLTDMPDVTDRTQFTSMKEIPLFLATSIYAFEGIGVVLPLHKQMKTPDDLGGASGVLNTAMILVTTLYIGVGFYGYLKYGDTVQGSITLSLPQGDPLAMIVNILFTIAIYLTYFLMLYVPAELLWPYFKARITGNERCLFAAFKILLVCISGLAAGLIPHIGLFISLVGAVASSMLALVFPPMIYLLVFHQSINYGSFFFCIFISLFGMFSFVFGTYTSVVAIVAEFTNPAP